MSEVDWKLLVSHKSWFEAVVGGEGNTATGMIENIQAKGAYVRGLGGSFLPEDRVTIDICVRGLDKRHFFLTLNARVVQADKRGAYFRFRPMALPEHAILQEVVEYASVYHSGRKNPHEDRLNKEMLGLLYSHE